MLCNINKNLHFIVDLFVFQNRLFGKLRCDLRLGMVLRNNSYMYKYQPINIRGILFMLLVS